MDILKRIENLRDARGSTNYKLSKATGISEGSISNLFRRGNLPTLPTLIALCDGFCISVAQFFTEGKEPIALTDEQQEVLDAWGMMSPAQRQSLLTFLKEL